MAHPHRHSCCWHLACSHIVEFSRLYLSPHKGLENSTFLFLCQSFSTLHSCIAAPMSAGKPFGAVEVAAWAEMASYTSALVKWMGDPSFDRPLSLPFNCYTLQDLSGLRLERTQLSPSRAEQSRVYAIKKVCWAEGRGREATVPLISASNN